MAKGFKRLFWAVLIATFNLKLGGFVILPAFVGWLTAVTAFPSLSKDLFLADWSGAGNTAVLLTGFSLFQSFLVFGDRGGLEQPFFLLFLQMFLVALELILFHQVLEASAEHLDNAGQSGKADETIGKDKTYLILMGLLMTALLLGRLSDHQMAWLAAMILGILARVYLLSILYFLGHDRNFAPEETKGNIH